ncbi:MAG: polymer-forming cytoskeletal protein [Gemmatimonadetes bacterium]|nr:polymer-forming cytoskeletal protein [Gemmatimonadota bacterium]
MRAGNRLPTLFAAALLLQAGPLSAASIPGAIEELSYRARNAIPALFFLNPTVAPQAVPAAAPQGPTVNPAHLDNATTLERDLRAALRSPLADTRLTVTGGSARLGDYSVGSAERIAGHVVVLKGNADIHGRIEGNVVALDGDVVLHPGAVITGDVLSIGGHIRQLGGLISGSQMEADAAPTEAAVSIPAQVARRGAGLLGVGLTLIILGLGVVTFGRPNLEIVSDTVVHSFGRAFLVGLLGQVLILPTFGMLIVGLVLTIAGTVLVPFAAVVYVLIAIIALVGGLLAVAHAMGETITRRRMAQGIMMSPNAYRYVITGLASLATIWLAWVGFGWVPVAGAFVFAGAVLLTWSVATVGFGAALLSRGGVREHFAGRILPPELMTDEYLWATPQFGVPAVKRPSKDVK